MKKALVYLPMLALLYTGAAAPAAAEGTTGMDARGITGTRTETNLNGMNGNTNGIMGNQNGTMNGRMDRTNTIGDLDQRTYGTRGTDNTDRIGTRNNNNGTYRTRANTTAANDNNTNWSWLGLLGLLGLAGMFRGSNKRAR